MGRITAPFGVKGWVKVRPNTAAVSGLLDYRGWWVGSDAGWRECAVAEARAQNGAVVAKLEGCDSRDAAAILRGAWIAVPRAARPAAGSGEYYWADLVGLKVVNTVGQDFGVVAGILQTGANDVLVVDGGRERLIPFIAAVIREVDPASGVIRVEWDADY